jgi:adenylate cyclase
MIAASDILHGKILIVDDQEANVVLLERMLRGAGYDRFTSTRDSTKVCELHLVNRYDLILLDLQMPGMDGFQVMENLKEIEVGSYLPVLVITAQPAHRLRALKAGAMDFLSKPLDLAEVLIRVHNMLEVRLLHLETKALYQRVLAEQKVSERLLLAGLPGAIAEHLQGRSEGTGEDSAGLVAASWAEVAVLFADIVAFTKFSEGAGAEVLVHVLNDISTRLDDKDGREGFDRNRTTDDAYVGAAALTEAVAMRTMRASQMALDMIEAVDRFNGHSRFQVKLRIGIEAGANAADDAAKGRSVFEL